MNKLFRKIIDYFKWSKWEHYQNVDVYWGKHRTGLEEVWVRYRLRDNKPQFKKIKRW